MANTLEFLNIEFSKQEGEIRNWLEEKYKSHNPLIYSSVDLRYSGHKLTPVDTNIFPAGFNNLSDSAKRIASNLLKEYLDKYHSGSDKILLISESHSRNQAYLDNITILASLFTGIGKEIQIATIEEVEDGIFPVAKKQGNHIVANGFIADLIVVNNDFTSGHPQILHGIEQKVIPAICFGWYRREKYRHFQAYRDISNEFCQKFSIPKFLINTEIGFCKNINFKERKGLECIAIEVEKTLRRIREGYKAFDIQEKPYVYLKANRGTYGMGIMTISDPEEIFSLNKKNRNKMDVIKNKTQNAEIVIQEGVPTIDSYNDSPAEPFIYQIAGKTAGIIYRFNKSRDKYISLNATGAEFSGIPNLNEFKGKYLAYDIIASLATLATCYEEEYY